MQDKAIYAQLAEKLEINGRKSEMVPRILEKLLDADEARLVLAAAPPLQKHPNKQKELCEQAALAHLEKCIGENSALAIGAASLPCEATVLAGPEIFAACEGIMETVAIPPLVGAAGACISQYKNEVSRCGR